MQDAFYKPHQINDEVFCVIYAREQMFKPILLKGIVSSFARFSESTTYYHILPLQIYGTFATTLTLRYVHQRTKKAKDITFTYDSKNVKQTWAQQFVTEHPDYLIDLQQWSVFADLKSAIECIHTLNNSAIMQIATEMSLLTEQNAELSKILLQNV